MNCNSGLEITLSAIQLEVSCEYAGDTASGGVAAVWSKTDGFVDRKEVVCPDSKADAEAVSAVSDGVESVSDIPSQRLTYRFGLGIISGFQSAFN